MKADSPGSGFFFATPKKFLQFEMAWRSLARAMRMFDFI